MKGDTNSILSNQNDRAIRFTPRELIKYHMEHPEIPITDEHIANLVIDVPVLNSEHDSLQPGSNHIDYLNKNNNHTTPLL